MPISLQLRGPETRKVSSVADARRSNLTDEKLFPPDSDKISGLLVYQADMDLPVVRETLSMHMEAYEVSTSYPTKLLPVRIAATAVEPLPMNGSSNGFAFKGIEMNEALYQGDRERSRMSYAAGRFSRNMPHTSGRCHELIAGNGGSAPMRSIETLFGENQYVLMQVSERRISGRHPRAPCTRACGPFGLDPYYFSTHQIARLTGKCGY